MADLQQSSILEMFGRKCYIKRNGEKSGKFNVRDDEGIFLGYSHYKKAKSYRCYDKNNKRIVYYIDVKVDEYVEAEVNRVVNTNSPNQSTMMVRSKSHF